MTYVTQLSQIPETPHWAIITINTIHIPGDKRSRTNPGHGYPASVETVIVYRAFTDEAEWKKEIVRMATPGQYQHSKFSAMKVIPASVEVSINIDVNEQM